jgi:cysteinyl-tRNA synthetase
MSKSAGNFKTIRDVLALVPGEAARFFILKTHYRSTLDFTNEGLFEAKRDMDKFYRVMELYPEVYTSNEVLNENEIDESLMDDLNTPDFITKMHSFANAALSHKIIDDDLKEHDIAWKPLAARYLYESGKLLGLFNQTPEEWFRGKIEDKILGLIEERNQARANKNWFRSDEIRNSLKERGIILEDNPNGTVWRKI